MKHLVSRVSLFHLSGLKTPKEIWDQLASLYGKKDDLRVYQLENKSMSLQPSNFETLNDFFTKFKHIVLLLKQCEVNKEDDKLILAIISKLGDDYLVFLSTFHVGTLTTPGWKIPSLNAFIESLTSEHDNIFQIGIIDPTVIKPSLLRDPRIRRGKERSRRTPKPNSKLLILKFKTNNKKSLLARRRTKTKATMGRKNSSVHTTGRASTLNMPA